jgi:phage repressor protein C with HTH and peptisase S24 domain
MNRINTKRISLVNPHRIIRFDIVTHMPDASSRLRRAREAAGYRSSTEAAQAIGVPVPSYTHHENGTRGFSKSADRYARFFRVSLDWLLTGRGEMKVRGSNFTLPVLGKVGAGAVVDMPDNPSSSDPLDDLAVDMDGDFVLVVEGDSQWPRYLQGERIIVQGHPVMPERLVNQYAVVQVEGDGRRLLKLLRRGAKPNHYRLESHNAPAEDNVRLMAAWRVKCVWYG